MTAAAALCIGLGVAIGVPAMIGLWLTWATQRLPLFLLGLFLLIIVAGASRIGIV